MRNILLGITEEDGELFTIACAVATALSALYPTGHGRENRNEVQAWRDPMYADAWVITAWFWSRGEHPNELRNKAIRAVRGSGTLLTNAPRRKLEQLIQKAIATSYATRDQLGRIYLVMGQGETWLEEVSEGRWMVATHHLTGRHPVYDEYGDVERYQDIFIDHGPILDDVIVEAIFNGIEEAVVAAQDILSEWIREDDRLASEEAAIRELDRSLSPIGSDSDDWLDW